MISIYKEWLWAILFISFLVLQNASGQTMEWKWANSSAARDTSKIVDANDTGEGLAIDRYGNIYILVKYTDYIKNPGYPIVASTTRSLQKAAPNGKSAWPHYSSWYAEEKAKVVAKSGYFLIDPWHTSIRLSGYRDSNTIVNVQFGNRNASVHDACLDTRENILVTGIFVGTDFCIGNDTLPNNGFGDIFLVKYSQDGKKLWSLSAGGNDADKATSVTTDNDGNIYLAGTFYSDSISFGNILLKREKGNDLFLVKFDENGTPLWAKTWGSLGTNNIAGVCIDTAGNVIIAGNFLSSAITFDSNYAVNRNTGTSDIFLLKINAQGDFLWQNTFGGKDNDRVNALRSDHLGNLYLTGFFSSPEFECTNTTLFNSGGRDIFVIKLSPDNRLLYIESIGGAKDDEGADIGVDSTGSIILTGCFSSPIIHFGKFPLKTTFKSSAFLAKLSERITNIEEASPNSLLKIFPNPTKSTFHISGIEDANVKITIYSLTGEKIYESLLKDSQMIDLSGKAKGMYVYQLQKDGEVLKTGKLVVE